MMGYGPYGHETQANEELQARGRTSHPCARWSCGSWGDTRLHYWLVVFPTKAKSLHLSLGPWSSASTCRLLRCSFFGYSILVFQEPTTLKKGYGMEPTGKVRCRELTDKLPGPNPQTWRVKEPTTRPVTLGEGVLQGLVDYGPVFRI